MRDGAIKLFYSGLEVLSFENMTKFYIIKTNVQGGKMKLTKQKDKQTCNANTIDTIKLYIVFL